ncbi:MAG: hypothetical protein LBM62_02165 [Mediterranea sp.]|jgi:hypothetical protein|nr:hypothetical protein [Mediterranea sp.]
MIESLLYADFTDVITVSIGLNLVYVIFGKNERKNNEDYAFFEFLSTISDWIILLVNNQIKKRQALSDGVLEQLHYYYKTGKLDKKTEGAFEVFDRDIVKLSDRMSSLKSKTCDRIEALSKARHLSKIAVIFFLYGILVLFLSSIQIKLTGFRANVENLLFAMNILITFLLIYCIIWEFIKKDKDNNWFAPHHSVYIALFIVATIVTSSIYGGNSIISQHYPVWNIYYTLFVFFSGFILYSIVILFSSIVILLSFIVGIYQIKWNKAIAEIKDKMEFYKDELNAIDLQMSNALSPTEFTEEKKEG